MPNSWFVQLLSRSEGIIFIDEVTNVSTPSDTDRARLALLGTSLFIPLRAQQRLLG